MLDWLVAIQFPEGGFQGGTIDQAPVVPVTFNTGQILLGLAAAVEEFGEHPPFEPMARAADWLVATQDADGCWRKYPSPFAAPGDGAYETHVAWGLLEAVRRLAGRARTGMPPWPTSVGRSDGRGRTAGSTGAASPIPAQPFTHTIGYVLRGVLQGYRATGDPVLLLAALRTADGGLTALREDGLLPGRLDSRWRGTVRWACLTGSVQIAHCWLMLYQDTGDARYRDAAFATNGYVRRTMALDGPPSPGAGSRDPFPIDGEYGPYEYLNWACKFFIDSHML